MSNEMEKLPTSAKELRLLYGVCRATWVKWKVNLNIRPHAKIYTPDEVQKIVNHLGRP